MPATSYEALRKFYGQVVTSDHDEVVLKKGERDAVESAAFDGELYADQKVKVLRVPAAEPGSVVAFEYELAGCPYAMQDLWRTSRRSRTSAAHRRSMPSADTSGSRSCRPAVRGHRTWNDVARWYQNLAESRRAVSPAIEAKARALTASSTTTFEKIAALSKFSQRDIRYVAIEVGIGGYQPHQADAVLSTLYGDCRTRSRCFPRCCARSASSRTTCS